MEIPDSFLKRLIESEQRYGEEEYAIREEVAVLVGEDFEGEVLTRMDQGVPRAEAEEQAREELRCWMQGWSEFQRERMQEILHERIVRNYFVYRASR